MSERPDIIAEVWRWVEKADHDLRCAEYVLTLIEDCPTDTVLVQTLVDQQQGAGAHGNKERRWGLTLL